MSRKIWLLIILALLNAIMMLHSLGQRATSQAASSAPPPPRPQPRGRPTPSLSDFNWTPAPTPPLKSFPPNSVTFVKDIAPIIYNNCTVCHREGETGRLHLTSYDEIRAQAPNIKAVTLEGFMPPWAPEPGFGEFIGGRRLTSEELSKIAQWVKDGTPRGDGPEPPLPAPPPQWKAGTPDRVVRTSRTYTVPADGKADYEVFCIPLDNEETLYLAGVECLPSNRGVTHHIDVLTDSSGEGLKRQAASGGIGYQSFGGPGFVPDGFVGAFAPGFMPVISPPDTAFELRPHTALILLTHFTPTGKPEASDIEVGLHLCKTRPSRMHHSISFDTHDFELPAGKSDIAVTFSDIIPCDVDLLSIAPHAHLLCKEMRVAAVLPGGERKPIIWLRNWDFNFQKAYELVRPLRLPANTILEMAYIFDNSASNPRNPNRPPKTVHWGEATVDEMADCHIQLSPVTARDEKILTDSVAEALRSHINGSYHGEGRGFQNHD